MAQPLTSSAGTGTQQLEKGPPWELVHFDVSCARCGHDLRGRSEPVCPACGLEFSWEQAAPLEQLTCGKCNYHLYGIADSRCPECGTAVDWNEALLRYRRREKPLFEYHWRDRPVRSFFKTWLLSLRPSRLWRTISIHDPPQLPLLAIWVFLLLVSFSIAIPVGTSLRHNFNLPAVLTVRNVLLRLLEIAFEVFEFTLKSLGLMRGFVLGRSETNTVYGLILLWFMFTFASLLILRKSMRRCQVKASHVFRVCAYSLFSALPFLAFILAFLSPWSFFRHISLSHMDHAPPQDLLIIGLLLAHVIWALRQGYDKYLRMPHSFWIALASQLIAVSAALLVPVAIYWARHSNQLWNL